jgi:hypothetical protein
MRYCAPHHLTKEQIMTTIDELETKSKEAITHATELNETLVEGASKATKETGIFYKRIIEGKPTDLYHITNAFKKIMTNNIEATQQFFNSFKK